jgi:hypothetical protein
MRRILIALALATACLGRAHAWGPEGHAVIAMVAEDLLPGEVRTAARKILMGAPLVTTAIFADEYRVTHAETTRWHFVDIPYDAASFDVLRDCKLEMTGDCIIRAIERAKAVVKNPSARPFDRADALKYLVHFVGDLHQPFHAIGRNQADGTSDEGANKVSVTFFGESTNLHSLWDSGLILHTGRSAEEYAVLLKAKIAGMNEADWRSGTPVDWAMESHSAAKAGMSTIIPSWTNRIMTATSA